MIDSSVRPSIRAMFLCAVMLLLAPGGIAADFPLLDGVVVDYADAEQGREVLGAKDAYFHALNRFDRCVRLRTTSTVDDEQLLAHFKAAVGSWDPDEEDYLNGLWAELAPKLEPYRHLIPERLVLIKTDGREEGGASVAYTRATAIILNAALMRQIGSRLRHMLCHELFHVISRTNPETRDELYRLIGYESIDGLSLPADLQQRVLTNPDSPGFTHRRKVTLASGESIDAVPIFWIEVPLETAVEAPTFFHHLQVGFQKIESARGGWRAVPDGFHAAAAIPDLTKQLKLNTSYGLAIQPEEAMAENFVTLILKERQVPYADLLQDMDRILRQPMD